MPGIVDARVSEANGPTRLAWPYPKLQPPRFACFGTSDAYGDGGQLGWALPTLQCSRKYHALDPFRRHDNRDGSIYPGARTPDASDSA